MTSDLTTQTSDTSDASEPKIGFIGGGNMASSLIGGLLSQGDVSPHALFLFEPNTEKAAELEKQHGINITANNNELVNQCDVVVIAVKPQVLKTVLRPLADSFNNKQPLLVSVVAGITAASINHWLNGDFAIVRVMPNTPALVGMGASGMFANEQVSDSQRALTTQLMNAVGNSVWVNAEHDIDSVTALSGSGPAYFMLFIKSLIASGEAAGLDADTAKALAVQTAAGAAELIRNSDLPLQTLIDNVTSPNGTTEQALLSFKNDDLTGIVDNAFAAAKRRSEELAEELKH